MFTRQHYKRIAKIIHDSTYNDGENFCCLRDELLDNLVTMFKEDNELFDEDMFIQACIGEHDG